MSLESSSMAGSSSTIRTVLRLVMVLLCALATAIRTSFVSSLLRDPLLPQRRRPVDVGVQQDHHAGAAVGLTLQADRSARGFDPARGLGEAHPAASARGQCAVERVERPDQRPFVHPDPIIRDAQYDLPAVTVQ